MNGLIRELKRRNVFRVAVAYAIVGWLLVQISATIEPVLLLPEWFTRVVTVLALLGFPLALILSWAYEVTPEGIKKTAEVDDGQSITQATGQKLNYLIIAALIAVIAYQQFASSSADAPASEEPAGEMHIAIAVLPFSDLSQAGDQAYLGAGIAEEILNVLASVEGLNVTSRTSSFALGEQNLAIPEIANRLGVSHIVEGSIRKQEDRVRITAQLIEVAEDTHLWSDTYDGKLTDIFRLQDDIAGQISGALSQRLNVNLPAASVQHPDVDIAAYELYLRARELVTTRYSDKLEQALELLEAAVALEPGYADAWAELGAANSLQAYRAYEESDKALFERRMADSWRAAERATEINPNHALGLAVRGLQHMITGNYLEARVLFDRATSQPNAGNYAWLWSGIHYAESGFFDKALATLEAGLTEYPKEPNLTRWLGNIYELVGEPDIAVRFFDDAAPYGDFNEVTIAAAIRVAQGEIDWPTFLEVAEQEANNWQVLDLSVENFDPETRQLIDQSTHDELYEAVRESRSLLVVSKYFAPTAFTNIVKSRMQILLEGELRTNELGLFWTDEMAGLRATDEFDEFIEEMRLVPLWKLYGWPPYCQPDQSERGFSCR